MVIGREWNYVWTGFLSHNPPFPSLYLCFLCPYWCSVLFKLPRLVYSTVSGTSCHLRCCPLGSSVLWDAPLAWFSTLCDKSFNVGCSVCPQRSRLLLTFYCNIKKRSNFILKFCRAPTEAHNTIILGKVCTWRKGCNSQSLYITGKKNLYIFLFGTLLVSTTCHLRSDLHFFFCSVHHVFLFFFLSHKFLM